MSDEVSERLPELMTSMEPVDGAGLLAARTQVLTAAPFPAGGATVTIVKHIESSRDFDSYEVLIDRPEGAGAERHGAGASSTALMRISNRETGALRLHRQAEALAGPDNTAFIPVLMTFDYEGRVCLVQESPPAAELLSAALDRGEKLPGLLPALTQAAHSLAKLHARGWALLALNPEIITRGTAGKPLRILDASHITPSGERPPYALQVGGCTAPEVAAGEPARPESDVYSLGALLFHAATGTRLSDAGVDLTADLPLSAWPGVPQILAKCLGPAPTRYHDGTALHTALLNLARSYASQTSYAAAWASTIGLNPGRLTNQDAAGLVESCFEVESGPRQWITACLADGMGGMQGGEVASEAAVQTILARAAQNPEHTGLQNPLPAWFDAANRTALDALDRLHAMGGCTLSCVYIVNRTLRIGHIGDSRVYLIRGGAIQQLTRDHSLAAELVELAAHSAQEDASGKIDVRDHPDRSQLTRSLGSLDDLPPSYVDSLQPATGAETLNLEYGDVLLLCSDGLWEPILETEMVETIQTHHPDLQSAAQSLVELSLHRGGDDNATVLLLRIDEKRAY